MNFESLSDLTTYLQRGISPKYAESGISVINQKCIRNGQLKNEDIKFHDIDKTYSHEKELRKNDILVNSTGVGTLGRVARFSNEKGKMLADSHVTIVRPDVEKIVPLYLFYVLRFNEPTIVELGAGSTGQTELSRLALGSLQIPTPNQGVQRYVADTLAYIDEKIQSNQMLSKTLEEIAQTIFKSWFIDFDPVKAKMAGEKPVGMDAATAALFPDSMEESELGMIPKGWEVTALGDVCATTIGGLWGNDEESLENPDSYQCIRGVDMDDLKALGYAPRVPIRWDKLHNFSKRLLSGTQILIAGSGAGPVAKSLLWDETMNTLFSKPVVFSNFVKRFECNSNEMASFVSSILTTMYESREIFTFVNGTSVPNLQDKELLIGKKVAVPSIDLLQAYDKLKRTSIKRKYIGENSNLVAIRDSLLPRLISGELQIPEKNVGIVMVAYNEDAYELQCLDWLQETGWSLAKGPEIAHDGLMPERSSHKDILLVGRVEEAISRINPGTPKDVIKKVRQMLESPGETDVLKANQQIHQWMTEGVPVKIREESGEETTKLLWLIDFENIENNDWLAVNQYSVQVDADAGTRRPDIVLFLNGIPISVLELKNPSDLDTDIWQAFEQLQTYKAQISRLFYYNSVLMIADGADARMGSLTADQERFLKWRSVDGEERDPNGTFGHTQTLIEGLYSKRHVLDMIQHFTVFIPGQKTIKMLPAYHQFFAVQKAYTRALTASADNGDGRGGLMWHTQGAGKSFEMACLAGMLATSKALKNPTIVVVTDRKNLDHQLFDTFVAAKALMRQTPEQADSREEIREMISTRPVGGVIFTTIQKFAPEENETQFPALTERRNVFVFTDEAHRSQYGFSARIDKDNKFKVGYAQHLRDAMPNATFVAFTGTPVAEADRDTRLVFGDEIDVYDMAQANEDGATVPIYYESRLVALELPDDAKKELDELAEDLVEDEEESMQANLKKRWAELEQIVGAEPRLEKIAQDIVSHYENRCKSPELADGKAMVVGMSRNICVDLYNQVIKIRPEWHNDDHRKGAIKIVFHSSASDNEKLRPHAYTEPQKRDLENRFKDSEDELKIVIVRDMWLTGYDSPPCHTMYVDKPMKGHNLMQAIARVNRVFHDKPGGLVVDYIGIATELKDALATYTKGKKEATPVEFIEEAMGVFFEKLTIVRDLLHGCSIEGFHEKPHAVIPKIADFIIGLEDGKKRFADASAALSKAYALVNSQAAAIAHREEVALYQAIRVMLTKGEYTGKKQTDAERELLIRQALSRGIVPEGIIDIFSAAGLDRPNIGLLSEEFLREIRAMKERNLAVEALSRLLKGEIKARFKTNIVKNSQYSELLEAALSKYRNRSIETAQLIEELIDLAKKLNEQIKAGNPDGLTDYEVSFYDALEVNAAAVREMKHEDLVRLAQELTRKVRENIKVDWSVRESTQAALRVMVRDLLDKYGYPPDFSNLAIETVIKQAESLTEEWLNQHA